MLKKVIVDRDDSVYLAWPDIVMTDSGTYICTYTECTSHGNRDNSRILMIRSYDKGQSWVEKKPFTEYTQKDAFYNNSRIFKLRDGNIYVICDKEFGREDSAQIWLWKGDKEGKNFEKPVMLPLNGIVPDKVLQLKSGRLIVSAHTPINGRLTQRAIYSDDNGKTWSEPVIVGQHKDFNLCEVSLIETPDGKIVAFMRENSGRGYDCKKSISHDGGKTFEGIYSVPIPACHRPVAGYLDDDTIMVTYRMMQGGSGWLGSWTQNVMAAFLPSDCILKTERNHQSCRIFPLDYDRSPYSDLGYTGWVKDGDDIFVVNYIVDDAPKAHIRGYRFTKDDVIMRKL